jgi:uncharacterized protein (TIGR02147 family)
MTVFEFDNYKIFIEKRFKLMPKGGYGQAKKLAEHMGVSTTFVSQVLKGNKELNLEQAANVCAFLGLTELETEYFLKLVSYERAGTDRLKKILLKEINKLKSQSQKLSQRLDVKKVIPDAEKAIFYSDWYYSAIRLLVGIKGFQDIDSIAEYFGLPRKLVSDVMQFLLNTGLCVEENGIYDVGVGRTHLDADSPFIKLHHLNWRYRALENIKHDYPTKLHYSAPMTLSHKDAEKVRERLVKTIEEVGKLIDPSPNEELMCLNMDWFKIKP